MDTQEYVTWNQTGYEDLFRVIGHLLDTEGWREVRLVETPDGIRIAARRQGEGGDKPVSFALGGPQLDAMLRAARRRRGSGRASALLAAADAAAIGA